AYIERMNFIFDEFKYIYFSVSAGKDSSVMVQLGNKIAKEKNRYFDIFFIDLEAQYDATIKHMEELKKLSQIRRFYHICLPVNMSNANSIFQTHWESWNVEKKDIWVRDMPKDSININNNIFKDFIEGEEVESFMLKFPKYLIDYHKCDKIACLIGIRADESLNRFRAIAFGKSKYKSRVYSTKITNKIINFYPIYDWKTQDIWGAISKFNLKFNKVYEMLYKNGISIHEQRICQPYGADQRVSLNQWAKLEPETWAKVVNRVSGANFGNIYCKTTLLGHNGTEKPNRMTWQEYFIFLLESLGLYSKQLMHHYIRKIKIYFKYYKDNYNVGIKDIPDVRLPKEAKQKGKGIHWKKLAKCIERNDYPCRSLEYGLTISDLYEIRKMRKEWGGMLGIQTVTKEMRNVKEKIEKENENEN
ncbi:unnamed protein product, partial [marine sediment metagenome]